MYKRMGVLVLVLVLSLTMVGCRRQPGQEPTKKTPNQILWQIREHIKQAAKDVKNAHDQKLITDNRFEILKGKVEEASEYYSKLRAHYELWKELNEEYRSKLTAALLFVAQATQLLKEVE